MFIIVLFALRMDSPDCDLSIEAVIDSVFDRTSIYFAEGDILTAKEQYYQHLQANGSDATNSSFVDYICHIYVKGKDMQVKEIVKEDNSNIYPQVAVETISYHTQEEHPRIKDLAYAYNCFEAIFQGVANCVLDYLAHVPLNEVQAVSSLNNHLNEISELLQSREVLSTLFKSLKSRGSNSAVEKFLQNVYQIFKKCLSDVRKGDVHQSVLNKLTSSLKKRVLDLLKNDMDVNTESTLNNILQSISIALSALIHSGPANQEKESQEILLINLKQLGRLIDEKMLVESLASSYPYLEKTTPAPVQQKQQEEDVGPKPKLTTNRLLEIEAQDEMDEWDRSIQEIINDTKNINNIMKEGSKSFKKSQASANTTAQLATPSLNIESNSSNNNNNNNNSTKYNSFVSDAMIRTSIRNINQFVADKAKFMSMFTDETTLKNGINELITVSNFIQANPDHYHYSDASGLSFASTVQRRSDAAEKQGLAKDMIVSQNKLVHMNTQEADILISSVHQLNSLMDIASPNSRDSLLVARDEAYKISSIENAKLIEGIFSSLSNSLLVKAFYLYAKNRADFVLSGEADNAYGHSSAEDLYAIIQMDAQDIANNLMKDLGKEANPKKMSSLLLILNQLCVRCLEKTAVGLKYGLSLDIIQASITLYQSEVIDKKSQTNNFPINAKAGLAKWVKDRSVGQIKNRLKSYLDDLKKDSYNEHVVKLSADKLGISVIEDFHIVDGYKTGSYKDPEDFERLKSFFLLCFYIMLSIPRSPSASVFNNLPEAVYANVYALYKSIEAANRN